jgi:large subunit ribosomal protein L22
MAKRTSYEQTGLVRAEARHVRSSARKARLVLDDIRGRSVLEARAQLLFSPRAVARDIELVLRSAVTNAEVNHGLSPDDLVVHAAYADEGVTIKRFKPRARGRASRIRKRTSHIVILLRSLTTGELVEAGAAEEASARKASPSRAARVAASRKADGAPEVETAAAEAEVTTDAGEAEAAPKPKRARAAKAETAEATEAAEAKPKRTRAAKPKAAEAEEGGDAPAAKKPAARKPAAKKDAAEGDAKPAPKPRARKPKATDDGEKD